MVQTLTRNWGWMALRGAAAIAFGSLTVFDRGTTVDAMVLWFGVYAVLDGAFAIAWALVRRGAGPQWLSPLVGGTFGMAAGLLAVLARGMSPIALLTLIGGWAIVVGIAEVVTALRLRQEIAGEWMFVAAGLLALAFGMTLIVAPAHSALAMVLWIGSYALVTGLLLVLLGFRLRHWGHTHPAGGLPLPA